MIKHLVELGFRIFVLAGIVYMVSKGYTDFSTNTIIISLGLLVIIGLPFLIKVFNKELVTGKKDYGTSIVFANYVLLAFLLFEAFINREFVRQHIVVLVVVFIVQEALASSDFTAVSKKKRG